MPPVATIAMPTKQATGFPPPRAASWPIESARSGAQVHDMLRSPLAASWTGVNSQTMQVPEVLQLLNHLATLKDGATAKHVLRLANITACLAEQFGLPEPAVELLRQAAPLHDIGKIGIPDAILMKPGSLTPEEMAVMRTHPKLGADLIARFDAPVLQLGAEISLTHHERWDGTGYPYGHKGEDIPLSGRLVAVADVFDALTSERPYKSAWSFESALCHVKLGSGRHFDPAVVECLEPCLPRIRAIVDAFSEHDDQE